MAFSLTPSRACRSRTLRLESLESRELLSVTVLQETFKSFDFSGAGTLSGTWAYKATNYPKYNIPFKGNTTFQGTASYDSATHGTITINSLTGSGKWTTPIKNGTFQLTDGQITNGVDKGGTFTGDASGNLSISTFGNTSVSGPASGSFNGPKQTIGVNYRQGDLALNVKGTFTPKVNPADPTFGVSIENAAWLADRAGIEVSVNVSGPVHKAASYTAPAATIGLVWAKGPSYNNRVGQPLKDKISIDWNEASGSYRVTNLPTPPAGTTHLLLVTQYDGKTLVRPLPIPARPTLAINDVSITKGAGGTAAAAFTVTLSQATIFPVTVSYATANGTARSPADYKAITKGTLTFAPGETQKTINVAVVGNSKVNPDKTFFVRLKSPTWALLADGEGKGTIQSVRPAGTATVMSQWATPQAVAELAWYLATPRQAVAGPSSQAIATDAVFAEPLA